ncbi:hypothetical protein scyTo_0010104 [Scyliorhinus torazame]|uniref:Centriolar satellite-associated tubulin polyglutamylase complex regulator 1 n=1 Tax=Scyliorhinus torazame TaxID=75743 RepID=A0A401NZZ9_SCYTO|nr:hypothetical protein [Scyliorhinus torazame]
MHNILCPKALYVGIATLNSQTYVLTYIEDAVSQLLEFKEEFSKVGIARFLAEYFNSVQHGSHILFREFTFIIATPYNRASFIRMFWRCFRQIGKNGGKTFSVTLQEGW